MLVVNDESNKKIDTVTILLKKDELVQLFDYVKALLAEKSSLDHYHLSSEDYQQEITICMYDPQKIDHYSSRY